MGTHGQLKGIKYFQKSVPQKRDWWITWQKIQINCLKKLRIYKRTQTTKQNQENDEQTKWQYQ